MGRNLAEASRLFGIRVSVSVGPTDEPEDLTRQLIQRWLGIAGPLALRL
ncbi:MAG: hypothetical protein ACRERE_33205 [Candidatus Entotheonellia bacterium]